jgi:hypothetical protein
MGDIKILFRASLAEEEELNIASKYFEVIQSRTQIKAGDLIIPRYSFLPFGDELEKDCELLGAKLINTYAQHRYVADLQSWYSDLSDFTARTWFDPAEAMADEYNGSYFCKGETNSRKNLWTTHAYAKTKQDLMSVYLNLQNDGLIGNQRICIRQFEQLKTYDYSITGQPITKEFRVFVLDGEIMGKGYYWTNYPEVIEQHHPNPNDIPTAWLAEVIDRVKDHIPAFVVDVAEKADGGWIVIELNDLCMSGLSGVSAEELYANMARKLAG